ncbi:hypothetical protein V462_11040 [Pantoea ananatis 15320]|nr:hypothetical protein V462_11040 [Pantoea ananatis 15320]
MLVQTAFPVQVSSEPETGGDVVVSRTLHAGAVRLGVVIRPDTGPDRLRVRLKEQTVLCSAAALPAYCQPGIASLKRRLYSLTVVMLRRQQVS